MHMDVEPKIGVFLPPKMDGLFHGKPYEQMDDLGFSHHFWKHPFSEEEDCV